MFEILLKLCVTFFYLAFIVYGGRSVYWLWTHQIDPVASFANFFQSKAELKWMANRDQSKLYQKGVAIADVTGPVDKSSSEVVFQHLSNTENLKRDQEFEYQRLRLKILSHGDFFGQVQDRERGTLNSVLVDVKCEIVE